MFYYVLLPKFSSRGYPVTFPWDFMRRGDPESDINIRLYKLLKKSVEFYTEPDPPVFLYSVSQHSRRRSHSRTPQTAIAYKARVHPEFLPIRELIKYLDEQEINYHYEFHTKQATKGMRLVNPYTFDDETGEGYRDYFYFSMYIAVPITDAVIARLTIPEVAFVKTAVVNERMVPVIFG